MELRKSQRGWGSRIFYPPRWAGRPCLKRHLTQVRPAEPALDRRNHKDKGSGQHELGTYEGLKEGWCGRGDATGKPMAATSRDHDRESILGEWISLQVKWEATGLYCKRSFLALCERTRVDKACQEATAGVAAGEGGGGNGERKWTSSLFVYW